MIDQKVLALFKLRAGKEGPLGSDLLARLETASRETREMCARYADDNGLPLTARKVRLWLGEGVAA